MFGNLTITQKPGWGIALIVGLAFAEDIAGDTALHRVSSGLKGAADRPRCPKSVRQPQGTPAGGLGKQPGNR